MGTDWMDDPAVAHIDRAKLDFLQSLVFDSKNLTKEQMMPFFMAVIQKSRERNIRFSKEEVDIISSAIRRHSSAEELGMIDKLMKLRGNKI